MVEPGTFIAAGGKFAASTGWRAVRDKLNRGVLEAAYETAAGRVVDHYEGHGHPGGTQSWNGIVSLLRDPTCGDALALGGAMGPDELEDLKYRYTQADPPLLDVLIRMTAEVVHVCKDTLPRDDRTVAAVVTTMARLQQALTMEQNKQLDRLERGVDRIYEKLDLAQVTTPTSAARVLPSDEDYRVDRPELNELADRLARESVVGIGGVVGVGGLGGVGKSLLAVRFARESYEPDRVLYATLDSGSTRTRMVALGQPLGLSFTPEHTDGEIGRLLRDALSGFDGLLVLDNADDAAEVRALLPAGDGPCRVIVTSRDQALLRSVTGSDPILMDVFTPEQARRCFRERLGEDWSRREREAVDSLCEMLGRLPIAVDVAAATIHDEQSRVALWLEAFPTESDLLDTLPEGADETGLDDEEIRRGKIVHAVLRLSLRGLSERAQHLLYALACFDAAIGGPEEMVRAVAGVEAAEARLELNRLHQRSILSEPTPGTLGDQRHTMHRLMREVVQRDAGERLDEYQARSFAVVATFPEVLTRTLEEAGSAIAQEAFDQEEANLEAVARAMVGDSPVPQGASDNLPRRRAEFAAHVAQFADFRWPTPFRRRLLTEVLKDAQTGGWEWLQASIHGHVGDLDVREDRLSEAAAHYGEAMPIYREIGARVGEANTLQALGTLDIRESRLSEAAAHYAEALPIYREIGARLGEANPLKALGDLDVYEDRLSEAAPHYEEALPIYREIRDRMGEANTLKAIGDLGLREGRLSEVAEHYGEALAIYREIRVGLGEANTLRALGDLDVHEDRPSEAAARYGEALPIYREIGDRLGEANTLQALGQLDVREDRLSEAAAGYRESLPIYREIRHRLGEAYTLQGLAIVDSRQGDPEKALSGFQAALRLHEEIDDGLGMRGDWAELGRHHMRNDQPREAALAFESSLEALPKEGDPVGYGISLRGLLNALSQLGNVSGVLACLRTRRTMGYRVWGRPAVARGPAERPARQASQLSRGLRRLPGGVGVLRLVVREADLVRPVGLHHEDLSVPV